MRSFKQSIGFCGVVFLFCLFSNAQQQDSVFQQQSDFWKKVRFGATFGQRLKTHSVPYFRMVIDYFEITAAPSAVYQINKYFETGIGFQASYIDKRIGFHGLPDYKANVYGGSLIALVNPIKYVQFSTEVMQLHINKEYYDRTSKDYWNTALFVGLGYRARHLRIGFRYNVLEKNKNNIYKKGNSLFVSVYY